MATRELLPTRRHVGDGLLLWAMGPDDEGRTAVSADARRTALRAILALALASALLSLLHLAAAPPFSPPDENAHVAYALAVGDGELPELRDFPDGSRIPYMSDRNSQFASTHPPLVYAVLAIPLRLTEVLGVPLAGLYAARLLMVASAAAGYILLGLLGLALLPSRPSIAVVATGIAALTPYQVHLAGVVYNDAPAFAIITGVLLVAVVALRRGLTARRLALLALLGALAANMRAVGVGAAAVAAAAAGLAVLLHDERGWARRLGRGILAGVVVGGVALASSAWFYLLNWRRYESFTGSAALLEIHSRETLDRSTMNILFERGFWRTIHSHLWGQVETYTTGDRYLPREMMIFGRWVVAGLVFAFLAWAVWRIVQGAWRQPLGAVVSWLMVGGWFAVLALAMADFTQGGGGPHARYLWPGLVVVHLAMALGLATLPGGRRGIPALLFLGYLFVANANNLLVFLFRREVGGPVLGLRALAYETPAAALAVVGAVGAVGLVLLVIAGRSLWRLPTEEPPPASRPLRDVPAVMVLARREGGPIAVDLRDVAVVTVVLGAAGLLLNHVYALEVPPLLVPLLAAAVSLAAAAAAGRRRPHDVPAG